MVENTNAYAAKELEESKQSGSGKWEEVTPEELSLWLGIVMYMGSLFCSGSEGYLES